MSASGNKSKCIIRTARLEDAESILSIQNSVIAEGEYLITIPEEFNKTPVQQREWIQRITENERENFLVAEINGEIVGWLAFQSQNRKRMSHIGSFGMMISKHYRGKGIGKMLLEELMEWAEKNPLIEKICLGVFSTNQRAISLYKSMGFIEEGRKVKEIKIDENEYVDDILMYRFV